MLARKHRDTVAQGGQLVTHREAKKILRLRGWSYRSAAPVLGVHYTHLCQVLNGQRISRRLLNAIHSINHRHSPTV